MNRINEHNCQLVDRNITYHEHTRMAISREIKERSSYRRNSNNLNIMKYTQDDIDY